MSDHRLTIAQLEAAINRARAASPSTGRESSLGDDVATLGALYGQMIYRGVVSVERSALAATQQAALTRWSEDA